MADNHEQNVQVTEAIVAALRTRATVSTTAEQAIVAETAELPPIDFPVIIGFDNSREEAKNDRSHPKFEDNCVAELVGDIIEVGIGCMKDDTRKYMCYFETPNEAVAIRVVAEVKKQYAKAHLLEYKYNIS